ncbi:hypothetical protein O7632_19910 [Solwaraspora sp. WMMD406]|uniref:hypothetical protein n=1 Tax=Solwaraspora sp. WMMD406 TaxID=3016095 RepID=UPI002417AEB9|nr:hypothetical protein [Solwaraspora sp. WMMD406]MDG4766352.1 hypothetical protein [Solwaraspora sp. WMMD406]
MPLDEALGRPVDKRVAVPGDIPERRMTKRFDNCLVEPRYRGIEGHSYRCCRASLLMLLFLQLFPAVAPARTGVIVT